MSVPDGRRADAYDASTTDLVLGELADVLRAAGHAADHVVVIGGLVPSLLVSNISADASAHVGTTDLDVCLSLALINGETAEYERLEKAISAIGFAQTEQSFRWVRRSGMRMTLEFFCPASEERPPGQLFRPAAATAPIAKHNLGGRLSAFALSAGEALVTDVEIVDREVTLPDGRGCLTMSFRVAGPLAFLLAKRDAIRGRDKPKDAYDVVWLIENWPGGPVGAAGAVSARPAFTENTRKGLLGLQELFADEHQVGPASYASFVAEPDDDLRERRRAVGAVGEFFGALDAVSS